MVSEPGPDEYAPSDYTDGRSQSEWKTRYTDEEARKKITWEAIYCGAMLLALPPILIIILRDPVMQYLVIVPSEQNSYPVLAIAWIAGTMGGVIFVTKWLYHVVGSGYWNEDRYLWRFLTPPVSGVVALSFVALITSEYLPLLSITGIESVYGLIGVSFLIGYFSDTAIAKMREIAEVLFGTVTDTGPSKPDNLEENGHRSDGENRNGTNADQNEDSE